jgi:hypothetical protein
MQIFSGGFMNKLICSVLVLFLLVISCQQKNNQETNNNNNDVTWQQKSEKILVLDEDNTPLNEAQLLIGNNNDPALWIKANESGEIAVPSTWNKLETLTVSAPGFIVLSLFNQSPSVQTIKLKKLPKLPELTLKGEVSGITTKDKDGLIDFALVMDSFKRKDIFQFDVNKIISPWTETITAAGFNIDLPQNIFLPKQKESYFITITLQKLSFTLNFPDYGNKNITSIQGRFPFKKVLSDVQDKKPYYELVNLFEMMSSSQVTANFQNATTLLTIPANQNIFNQKKSVVAPELSSEQVMLGLNCLKSETTYSPIDIKYFKSKELIDLKAVNSDQQYFVGVLKNKNEFDTNNENTERMSLVILPWSTSKNYQFLPLMENPKIVSRTEFNITPPQKPTGQIIEAGYTAVISEVKTLTLASGKSVDMKLPQWEIFSPTWNDKIIIPDLNLSKDKKYRLEVSFMSQNPDNARNVNFYSVNWNHESQVENATHITKSAASF